MTKQFPLTIALIVGHKPTSPGAVNAVSGISEFEFNDALTRTLIDEYAGPHTLTKVYRDTYGGLPATVNATGADLAVSFHCNAFNTQASGTEVLFYHRSETGRRCAEVFHDELVACLALPDRGIKPKTSEDRGGYLLRHTQMPTVLIEPFFIDNTNDLGRATHVRPELVSALCRALDRCADIVAE